MFKGTLGDVYVNSTTSLLLYTKNCIMCWLSCLLCYSYEGHKVVGNFGRYARGAENDDVPVLVIGHVQIQALIYTFEWIKPLISKISSGMKTKWSYYIAQVVVADYDLNNWATPISISTIHTEISENNSAGSKDWFQMNYDTNIDHSNSMTYFHLHDNFYYLILLLIPYVQNLDSFIGILESYIGGQREGDFCGDSSTHNLNIFILPIILTRFNSGNI